MYKKIAVEDGLSNVEQALNAAGFQTTPLEGHTFYNVQAVVVRGDGRNILNAEPRFNVPVIDASGRSAEEVVDVLRDRLS